MTTTDEATEPRKRRLSTADAKLRPASELAEMFGATPTWIKQELIAAGLRWTEGPRGTVLLNPAQEDAFWKSRERSGDEGIDHVAFPVAAEPQLTRTGRAPRIPSGRPRKAPAQRQAS